MPGPIEYKDFYAICNHMPGDDRVLRVGGTLVFPTSGWSAELDLAKQKGINPLLLEFDLTVSAPPDGKAIEDVLTRFDLEEYRIEEPALEYQQVEFHLVDRDGEAGPGTIEVDHPQ